MKSSLILVFMALCLPSIGQNVLEGALLDDKSGAPIALAEVSILINDSLIQSAQSNFEGAFQLSVDQGAKAYSLNIFSLGYVKAQVDSVVIFSDTTKIEVRLSEEPLNLSIPKIEWNYVTFVDSTGTIRCVKIE